MSSRVRRNVILLWVLAYISEETKRIRNCPPLSSNSDLFEAWKTNRKSQQYEVRKILEACQQKKIIHVLA
jgi:hypothetical protein